MRNFRWCCLIVLHLFIGSKPCIAYDYCDLLSGSYAVGAVGFNPPDATALEIVRTLSNAVGFDAKTFMLRDSRDASLRAQGAAAEVCNQGTQRWIFYDPDFVNKIQVNGQTNWPKYFVFAHEMAHHVNHHPLNHQPDQELQADHSAARWLTVLGATAQDLADSIKAFVVNENSVKDYPSKCERVKGVILAYNEEAVILNKPTYEVGDCMAIAGGGGLYASRTITAGTSIRATDVQQFGIPDARANLPLNYDRDLSGMCTLVVLGKGDLLTWENVGVCSLMHR